MKPFSKIVKKLDGLTNKEILKLKLLLEKKWSENQRQKIIKSATIARTESANGKTVVLSSPKEIKAYFLEIMSNK